MATAPESLTSRAPEATIVARSSGTGPAAISVLRLSGVEALTLARRCLPGLPSELQAQRLYLTPFTDACGECLDEVLAAYFRGPRSYTGEDVVEIDAHGGPSLVAALERRLVELGARPAAPGEFTRRAVRNGRMDLIDAEALAALLGAETDEDLALARKAGGEGAFALRALLADAIGAAAEARGAEDHPLETEGEPATWRAVCAELAARCDALAGGPSLERRLHEGYRVVLLGPVNAGKSSLFNALLGERRALVDAQPGTTRDAVSATMSVRGRKITLYDTAGIRDASGLEREGIEMGRAAAEDADLVVWVHDGANANGQLELAEGLPIDVQVESKADLRPERRDGGIHAIIRVSAHTGAGLDQLRDRILETVAQATSARSSRQQRILKEAAQAMRDATRGPDDLATAVLERGVSILRQLVGEPDVELEDEIYRRFCIGK